MTPPRDRAALPIVEGLPANQGGQGTGRAASSGAPPRDVEEGDLHELLTAFYDTVELEPLLAPYFAVVDMDAHMPRIVDFWSTMLFHTGRYSGSAF